MYFILFLAVPVLVSSAGQQRSRFNR